MTTLLLILAFIVALVLGSGLTFLAVASYIVTASNDGELAIASWDNKEKRWKVFGNYLSIAGKITNLIKFDSEKVTYIDTTPKKKKPKGWSLDGVKSKNYKGKYGVKR